MVIGPDAASRRQQRSPRRIGRGLAQRGDDRRCDGIRDGRDAEWNVGLPLLHLPQGARHPVAISSGKRELPYLGQLRDEHRESRPREGPPAWREVAVVSNDFTVFGASSGATNGRKIGHMKRVATSRGLPMVFLGESSGARMPDHMGARGMGALLGNDPALAA